MNCNCHSVFQQKLREQTKDEFGSLSHVFYFKDHEMKGASAMIFTFNARKKNGEKKLKKETTAIICAFCPFCGVKIDG